MHSTIFVQNIFDGRESTVCSESRSLDAVLANSATASHRPPSLPTSRWHRCGSGRSGSAT
jgi:hypothetical protein